MIDGRDMIVMPGFVDTHWHLWSTALRLVVRADDPNEGYFPTTIRVGRHFTPQDIYIGVRLGVAEGLLSGITTVHDWSHNTVSPAARRRRNSGAERHRHSRPLLLRHRAGLRRRQDDGSRRPRPRAEAMERGDGMLSIGACLRTPGLPGQRGSIPVELFRTEFDAIRKLGLPTTIHCGPKNLIDLMGKNNLLGPDMLLVHPQGMTADELKMVGETQVAVEHRAGDRDVLLGGAQRHHPVFRAERRWACRSACRSMPRRRPMPTSSMSCAR